MGRTPCEAVCEPETRAAYGFARTMMTVSKPAGFLPAALVVVLVMFGLWSLGKADLLWYVAPALVALLLQMAQAAHERINVLHVLPMALAAVLLALLLLPSGRLTIEPLAVMLRKDYAPFKKLVDAEVTRVITQGEIQGIYKKWFESPIPPDQVNLRMPMSYMLRDSFKVPTDWLPN